MPDVRTDSNANDVSREKSAEEVLAEAEAYGVDLSQLRERLKLTPTERVKQHQAGLEFAHDLWEAGAQFRRSRSAG